jgi:hypothetical protein
MSDEHSEPEKGGNNNVRSAGTHQKDIEEHSMRHKVEVVQTLISVFRWERMTYLSMTASSVLLLLICAAVEVLRPGKEVDIKPLVGLLGSTGTLTYSISRILMMWNQAFRYVTDRV